MKKDLTEIVFILDKSGSMAGLESDTIGGFNALIEKQKKVEGEALISTVLFNSYSTVIHDRVPLEKIEPMTEDIYTVSGCTALLDAVGNAIRHIELVHKDAREEDVPEHTMFVITTDGLENSSRKHTVESVRKLITEKQEANGWDFIFLGANIDAVETASSFGIPQFMASEYYPDKEGTSVNFDAMSKAISMKRCEGAVRNDWRDDVVSYLKTKK